MLDDIISNIQGIGDKTLKLLKKLNIILYKDLIHYYPRSYEGKNEFINIEDIFEEGDYIIEGAISENPINIRKRNLILTKTKVKDNTGTILVTWFNQAYLAKSMLAGEHIILKGKVTIRGRIKQMVSPKILKGNDIEINSAQELFPIYALIKGITNKQFRNWINIALAAVKEESDDFLPKDILNEYNLLDYYTALRQIHNPINHKVLEDARNRLIFNEFLLFQFKMLQLKNINDKDINDFHCDKTILADEFVSQLPFNLTNAQKNVWKHIKADLKGKKTMNRLIQGDVGSGKTVIALLTLLAVVDKGYQGALMAPTEVLAKQHYESINDMLKTTSLSLGLLVGSMTKKEKENVKRKLLKGEIQILIGTHAVIQEDVEFDKLAVVVTDEQHRFGVKQREALVNKGKIPHVLVMSATPIPRTLALIIYGDMDVSIIDELPPGRQLIKTYSVNSSYRDRIFTFIQKEVCEGRQAYIVCPAIEENEELEMEAVLEYTEKAKKCFSQNIRIASLHGKMKPKDKNYVMEQFAEGQIDILISTTVIEVGINVPNSTIMVIENAERFGLAGLHQLRGRVGRGKHQSYCVLVTDTKNSQTKKRIKVLEQSNDGFFIAEEDLKLRGPGDPLGIKQHGLPEFKIGNVIDNIDILKQTNQLAKSILETDIDINTDKYKELIRITM